MKVKEIIPIAEKILLIFKIYKNATIKEMLDDIYQKISIVSPTSEGKKIPKLDFQDITSKLEMMDKEEIMQYLKRYTKRDLAEICKHIDIKINSKDTKLSIMEMITKQYAFVKLSEKMSSRNTTSETQNIINNN